MPINLEDFIDDYLYELEENIVVVEKGILILKKEPANTGELDKIVRALHTIKGTSRMLNFANIEKISHGMENIYKGIRDKKYDIDKPFIQLTFIATNYLRLGIRQIKSVKNDNLSIDDLLVVFEKVSANVPYSLSGLEEKNETIFDRRTGERRGTDASATMNKDPAVVSARNEAGLIEYNTIRIRTDMIDALIKTFNDLSIKHFQLKKMHDTMSELEENIIKLTDPSLVPGSRQSGTMPYRNTCLKLIQNIKKDFHEKTELMEIDTRRLGEDIFSLRMLPLGLILDSLRKMTEETAISLGKEVDLLVTGGDVMLEKLILEKISDPLIHLIRNALDHGIEEPETREKLGKPRTGKIEIHCNAENGNIIIKIRDDGRGLDYDAIREKAVSCAPGAEKAIREMSNGDLHPFLFTPGFSTSKNITPFSGRGVGLDIVGNNILKIKGRITIKSAKDEGTEFTLSLPLSLAAVDGFFVSAAGEIFLVPAYFTKELMIIRQEDIFDSQGKKAVLHRENILPVYELASIIKKRDPPAAAKLYVLVVESPGERIGMIVDKVIRYASLVYKSLPGNLSRLKAIQGIVFNESFHIINILYMPEIINRLKGVRSTAGKPDLLKAQMTTRHILVVDDSYSTREIEKSILEMEKYNVTTAGNGVEGLEKIKHHTFHLIITDINMPGMDGMLFLEKIKQHDNYKTTPVIVVSSDHDQKIKEQFLAAGAAAFIVKSEFDRNNLAAVVKTIIEDEESARIETDKYG